MVKGEHIELSLPEKLNLGCYFLDVNLESGRRGKTALYFNGKTYSFLDLWLLTNKVGNVLKELGLEPENRVLLILEDSPEWMAAWLATMKVGGVGTHAYTYLKPHDYEYLLELVRPKIVVVDNATLQSVREGAKKLKHPKALLVAGERVDGLREREFSLQKMIESAGDYLEVEPTHRDDIAFWNFSSGTSGRPKAVPHTHRDGVIAYESFNAILSYKDDDIVLRVPKLFFHYCRDLGFLFPLRSGAAVILFQERATAPLIFGLIGKYRPTVLINVPTMMRMMIQSPEHERADLSCLRRSMSSGEQLSAELYEEWVNAFGCEVVNRFGSAESGMAYLCNRSGAIVPGSSGIVTPLAEVKLVNDGGLEVSRGQPGVLWARCAAGGFYYVREREKSTTTFLGDGWINTGDVFVQDENDYFRYMGRADEMVKVSGVWVSPLEIERSLQECPLVKECAVLGIKDKDELVKIKAFVVLAERMAASAEIAEELIGYCRKHLAPYKAPRAIEFMDGLPKTGQGKIDRRLLRERAL